MDTEKNTTPETNDMKSEAASFKAKREQWEAEWKAEFKRDWEKNWKSEWKKQGNWKKHKGGNAALKLEINDKTYRISLGKIVIGVVLLMILPTQFLLIGGAIWAAYHFGRQSAENDSNETPKTNHDEITAA